MNDALEVVQALMCCACNNPDHHDAAAVLAAASGPWAELRADLEVQQKQCKELAAERDALKAREAIRHKVGGLDAALARNAELEQRIKRQKAVAKEALRLVKRIRAERDEARAELVKGNSDD